MSSMLVEEVEIVGDVQEHAVCHFILMGQRIQRMRIH